MGDQQALRPPLKSRGPALHEDASSSSEPITSTKPPGLAIVCSSMRRAPRRRGFGVGGEQDFEQPVDHGRGRTARPRRPGPPGRPASGSGLGEASSRSGRPRPADQQRAPARGGRWQGAGAEARGSRLAERSLGLRPPPGQRHGLGACCADCRRRRIGTLPGMASQALMIEDRVLAERRPGDGRRGS